MARYIDEKDVYALVEPRGMSKVHCSQIDELPRADVVPKSEVVTEERCREIANEMIPTFIRQAKQEVAREIFEEMERNIFGIVTPYQTLYCIPEGYLAELKKKYTESEDKG